MSRLLVKALIWVGGGGGPSGILCCHMCAEVVLTCVCSFLYISEFVFLFSVCFLRDVLEFHYACVWYTLNYFVVHCRYLVVLHLLICTSVGTMCLCHADLTKTSYTEHKHCTVPHTQYSPTVCQ
jgi:hypothetical protein